MYKKTCLALAVLALGGCRIVSQQELADLKSPPNPHMANIDKPGSRASCRRWSPTPARRRS